MVDHGEQRLIGIRIGPAHPVHDELQGSFPAQKQLDPVDAVNRFPPVLFLLFDKCRNIFRFHNRGDI